MLEFHKAEQIFRQSEAIKDELRQKLRTLMK